LAYSRAERTPPLFKAPPKPVAPQPRDWAAWSTGYVALGSTGANGQRSAVDFTTSGISAGIDYRFNRYFIAGLGVGYGRDSTEIGTNGTHSNAEAYSTALYASLRPFGRFFIDSVAGYGTLKFGSQRFVVDDGDFVFGRRTGKEVFASVTSSYEFREGKLLLAPYARVNAAWITLDAFTETGGAGGALTYSAQTANIVTSVLGLRGKYTWLTTWGAIVPRARVEYNHDFSGSSAITLNYADPPLGQTFALTTAPLQRDRITLGLGTDFLIGDTLRLAADYREEVDFLGAQWHLIKLRLDARF
jgi:outer membrane autotransporter protein